MAERILVYGGRDFNDREVVFGFLDALAEMRPILTVIQGDCPTGADRLARMWAISNNHHFDGFAADWPTYGRAAGPLRNQKMIDIGKPTLGVGFPGGRGTADMERRLKRAGIPIIAYRIPAPKDEV